MEEKLKEQHQAELQQVQSFYNDIIMDLKGQIADMADQKSVQVAYNAQHQRTIQALQKHIQELESQVNKPSEK